MGEKKEEQRFYVYGLARPDGTLFYVGKGTDDRMMCHEREARRGHLCHKCNIIRKIWRAGGSVRRVIILRSDDEQIALDTERATIAWLRLQGVDLVNRTDGGEGLSGMVHSEATRQKQSAAHKGRQRSPEHQAALTRALKGRAPSYGGLGKKRPVTPPLWRAHLSAANKGRTLTEHQRAAVAEANRKRIWTPEQRTAAGARLTAGRRRKRTP